jgi:hypothetical protein
MVTNCGTGFAQCYDLGVRCGIGVRNVAVPATAHDPTVAYHDRAHRDLSRFESALGAAQGFLHPELVGGKLVGRNLVGSSLRS